MIRPEMYGSNLTQIASWLKRTKKNNPTGLPTIYRWANQKRLSRGFTDKPLPVHWCVSTAVYNKQQVTEVNT